MKTQYVLFCLENNRFLFVNEGSFYFYGDFKQATHFETKDEAVEFLKKEISNIKKETGVHHFTTREYFST